jgi:DNA gyrase subunit A
VEENNDIMLISSSGMVNRSHVREIRVVGRNTQGVRVINLKEGDKLAALAPVATEEETAEAPAGEPETPEQA